MAHDTYTHRIPSSVSITNYVPPEIWFHIVSCPNLRGDLKAVSLTCHTFRIAAQSILCEQLSVPTLCPQTINSGHLARFLTSDHVVGRVRSVTVGSVGSAVALTLLDVAEQHAMHMTVQTSEGYLPWSITPKEAVALSKTIPDNPLFLSFSQLRNLTKLSLCGLTLGPHEIFWLSIIPSLTQLHLERCTVYMGDFSNTHQAEPELQFKLRSLTVIESRVEPGALQTLCSPLVIEELTLLSLFYMELTLDVEVFPSLRFLQVPCQWSGTTLRLLPRCPVLQELKLREWGSYGEHLFPGPFPPPHRFRMQALSKDAIPYLHTYNGRIDDAWGILAFRPVTQLRLTSIFDTGLFYSWVEPLHVECPHLEDLSIIMRNVDNSTLFHLFATFRQLKTLRVSLRRLTKNEMNQVCDKSPI